ncbi:hypothetical protein C1I98_15130 [Spongiactinospora gelatinilytica]|uniref:Uncharacterized protein n=1 Tax=Spongiactinospora gelatinilytica TaxID=2666298 RepID=A0A2W2GCY0_9ACTN|nr:hypothetical protein C1I98_15130 [Spongiactinospora gelatinilytica]
MTDCLAEQLRSLFRLELPISIRFQVVNDDRWAAVRGEAFGELVQSLVQSLELDSCGGLPNRRGEFDGSVHVAALGQHGDVQHGMYSA